MSLSSQIKEYCKVKYSSIKVVLDQVEISVEKDNLLKLIQFLKDDPSCLFDQLSDITAVDYPNKKYRFLIIYQFLSITNNQRVRVLCSINANDVIPSISKLYFSIINIMQSKGDLSIDAKQCTKVIPSLRKFFRFS